MISTIVTDADGKTPLWVDVARPTESELSTVAERYHLHATSVHDCLDALHLPKHEKLGDTTFLIVRAFDESATPEDNTLQSMTKKIAIFIGDRFLITVHRREVDFMKDIASRVAAQPPGSVYLQVVMIQILVETVETFHAPLAQLEKEIGEFEAALLKRGESAPKFKLQMQIKTRLTVIRRLLWHTMNSVQKFVPFSNSNLPVCQDLKERIDSLQFFADKLADDLNNLLDIQMSMSSHRMMEAAHRTNEVMRFLTVVSLFFLPINFIASVYGMNFEHMPELKWKYGYAAVWVVILLVEGGIFLWFRKKGYFKSSRVKALG